ncbi:MAG: hypothetical protein LBJ62_07240 [Bifidobacteriaceae bacterium]|jgi:hypothetical protein|nr:hypothetical protein [Bifidobacteriaceae bacterium]
MSLFRRKRPALPQIRNEPSGPNPPCLISLAPPGLVDDKVTINLPGPSTSQITPLDERTYLVLDQGEGPCAYQTKTGLVSLSDAVSAAQAVCDGFVMRQLAAHPALAAQAGFSRVQWVFMPDPQDGSPGLPDADILDLLLANNIEYSLYL